MYKKLLNPKISIVVTHYGLGSEVLRCLKNLEVIHKKYKNLEIILVDNNEVKNPKIKKIKWLKYLDPKKNLGWGGGRNFAIKNTNPEFYLFLDSDCLIDYKSFINLVNFLIKNPRTGMVSPRFVNKSGKYMPEATNEMSPLVGIFYLSIINKLFPNNFVKNNYLINSWDRNSTRKVDVLQCGVFMIRTKALREIKNFDENYFLYFEENDIGKKLKNKNWEMYLLSNAKAVHLESTGTPKGSDWVENVFKKSRMHYFNKHYGILSMFIVEFFARISKENILIFLIILLGTFLRFYKLIPNAIFNGEMGTDYLNVKSMLDGTRSIWLGPRTSHEWFFIPPISYWVYAILFKIFGSTPLVINIFWGIIGVLAIYITYVYVKKLFNSKIALVSSFLIAVSPLWISMTRDARYNAPVAILFFPYLYYLKKTINDNGKSLFVLGLILGLMMSFFPSPILLIPAVIISFFIFKVKPNLKNIIYGIFGFIIPNIFYLFNLESIKNIIIWLPYRLAGSVGLYPKNTLTFNIVIKNFQTFFQFIYASFISNYN